MISSSHIIKEWLPDLQCASVKFKIYKYLLGWLLGEKKVNVEYCSLKAGVKPGVEFCHKVIESNNIEYTFDAIQLQSIPKEGPVVLVANHAQGIIDGVMLVHMLHKVRPDIKVVGNEMLSQIDAFEPILLYVSQKKNVRKQYSLIRNHLKGDGAVLIFPAGSISQFKDGKTIDPPWQRGFLELAKSASASVIPIHTNGTMSNRHNRLCKLGYIGWFIAQTLSFRELFFQSENKRTNILIGPQVAPNILASKSISSEDKIEAIRKQLYSLANSSD